MKALSTLLALGLASALTAQSPLLTTYAGGNGLAASGTNVYFNLTVNTTVTVQGLELHLNNAAIVTGTINFYLASVAPTNTYVGHELNAGDWTLAASGPITSNGLFGVPSPTCFATPLVLAAGTYGCCVNYQTVFPAYTNGNGSQTPGTGTNQTFSTAEMTLRAGASQGTAFVSTPFSPRVFNGGITYFNGDISATPIACSATPALNTGYGEGCYRFIGSWWDAYNTAVTASVALSNRSVQMAIGPTQTVVTPGTATIVAPPVSATVLDGILGDDGETTIAPTIPVTMPNGTTATTLNVHANGIVSDGPVDALLTINFSPLLADFLGVAGTPNGWWNWHDYNVTEAGSGSISWHEDPIHPTGPKLYVTWNNVESYPTTIANPGSYQWQYDYATTTATMVWGSVSAVSGGGASDLYLVGYSPVGTSLDHGFTDVPTFTSVTLDATQDAFPLTLAVTGRPVIGGTNLFTTSNQTPLQLGALYLSLSDLPPFSPVGLDLGIIGAAGCVANIDPGVAPIIALITDLGGPAGMVFPLVIPIDLSFVGNTWFAQSIWLDPAVNGFGMLTSNAIRQDVGTW